MDEDDDDMEPIEDDVVAEEALDSAFAKVITNDELRSSEGDPEWLSYIQTLKQEFEQRQRKDYSHSRHDTYYLWLMVGTKQAPPRSRNRCGRDHGRHNQDQADVDGCLRCQEAKACSSAELYRRDGGRSIQWCVEAKTT